LSPVAGPLPQYHVTGFSGDYFSCVNGERAWFYRFFLRKETNNSNVTDWIAIFLFCLW
jgi:hypothetical protein